MRVHQTKARCVAVVDVVITSMSLCLVLLKSVTEFVKENAPQTFRTHDGYIVMRNTTSSNLDDPVKPATSSWIFFAVIGLGNIVQLLGAVKLLTATQPRLQPRISLKQAQFWQRISAVIIMLAAFMLVVTPLERPSQGIILTQILLRVLAIYVVIDYIGELEVEVMEAEYSYPEVEGSPGLTLFRFMQGPIPVDLEVQCEEKPPNYEDVVKADQVADGEAAIST